MHILIHESVFEETLAKYPFPKEGWRSDGVIAVNILTPECLAALILLSVPSTHLLLSEDYTAIFVYYTWYTLQKEYDFPNLPLRSSHG